MCLKSVEAGESEIQGRPQLPTELEVSLGYAGFSSKTTHQNKDTYVLFETIHIPHTLIHVQFKRFYYKSQAVHLSLGF